MVRKTVRTRVRRFDATGEVTARADKLAGEEPLEVQLDGDQFTVTMRTPGNDVELVAGFLLSEAVITSKADIVTIDFASGLDPDGSRNYNVARVELVPGVWNREQYGARQVYTSSACGICGTASIESVRKETRHPVGPPEPLISPRAVLGLPDALREQQQLFTATGGVHAAAVFAVADDGAEAELLAVREDVGRHNAVDKVLGWALLEDRLPLRRTVLQVSGRASFELVQKAAMAGITVLSAVSAPSGLAVDLGRDTGVTVIGFNRGTTFNAYSHPSRIFGAADDGQ
ncbi:formate dehydrogenase accessory sulfurtransferase FdhD [Brevibacterium daeguense]|uniref:Sulfur carrier protein FdhD n=1 Tax=Brevibacterium daeguense TaxID=909936 RepID=A0ABP8EJW6_9MICO|nr:formate dehydrogenase accessory sulfurtransferase FdhD [Brevibacterium daeguense]